MSTTWEDAKRQRLEFEHERGECGPNCEHCDNEQQPGEKGIARNLIIISEQLKKNKLTETADLIMERAFEAKTLERQRDALRELLRALTAFAATHTPDGANSEESVYAAQMADDKNRQWWVCHARAAIAAAGD